MNLKVGFVYLKLKQDKKFTRCRSREKLATYSYNVCRLKGARCLAWRWAPFPHHTNLINSASKRKKRLEILEKNSDFE